MKLKKLKISESLFLLVVGLTLGLVFTFGMQRWNAPISRDEAIFATATIRSIEEQYGRRHHLKEVRVEFHDYAPLSIDGSCLDSELMEALRQMPPGTVAEMCIHPETNVILEMCVNNISLMDFDRTVETLAEEATCFMYLGIFCFVIALTGLISLLGYLFRRFIL